MKSEVLKIVKNALGEASEKLIRASRQFGSMSDDDLKNEYGMSGQTCGDILRGYKLEKRKLTECVNWVEKQEESS